MESNHREIFKQVVDSNIDRISNAIKSKSFEYSVFTFTEHLNEDEIRELAVSFFIKSLTENLKEYTDNLMFKTLKK